MKLEGLMSKGAYVNVVGLVIGVLFCITDQVRSQRSTQWTEGSLRLVGGSGDHEGTVLIYHWSRWGAICDSHWDLRDANVVCKELGFAGARKAVKRSKFGKGRRELLPISSSKICLIELSIFYMFNHGIYVMFLFDGNTKNKKFLSLQYLAIFTRRILF